jgi:hypothetical protein
MLTYVKEILQKVSFDPKLFEKELRKAIKALSPNEITEFRAWCYARFSAAYHHILDQTFGQQLAY